MELNEENTPTFAEHDDEPEHVFVVFLINAESYALSVTSVTEIVQIQHLMDVVDLPSDVVGVMNIRGRIVPVLDLKARFTNSHEPRGPNSVAVIVELKGVLTGLLVEAVTDVIRITPEMIQQSSAAPSGTGTGVLGIVNAGGKPVAVLDAALLLGSEETELGNDENNPKLAPVRA